MGANCNITPQLKIFFYYRFDLTKKTPNPPPKFYGCKLLCYTSIKKIFYYRFHLTKKTPCQNFMGANCNITPQLKIFFYYRFDLTKKTPNPPPKFYGCKLLCYTSIKKIFYYRFDLTKKNPPPRQNFMGANCNVTPDTHSRHNNNHVLPKRSTMLKSISC